MSFSELMQTPQGDMPEGVKARIPESWRSGVEYKNDKAVITTAPALAPWETEGVEAASERILRAAGMDPKAWMIEHNRIQRKEWQGLRSTTDEHGSREVVPVKLYSLKCTFVPRPIPVDIDELAELVTNAPALPMVDLTPEAGTYLIGIADMQLGKMESDVMGTVNRVYTCVQNSLAHIAQMGHTGAPIHIAWLGDEGEYHTSQGGRNSWRTTLTPTETSRLIRRIILRVIDMVLDSGHETISVSAVPSNHGEVTRHQQMTMDDDYTVDALVAVSDALELNPDRYGNVRCMVPARDTDYVCVEHEGVTVGMVHGHRIPGYPQPKRVFDFLAGQSLGNQPIGHADVLLTGHGHHLQMAERSRRLWVMAPALEAESAWWRARTGDTGSPGTVLMRLLNGRVETCTKIHP